MRIVLKTTCKEYPFLGVDLEAVKHLLALWASNRYLTDPLGKLNIFYG